MTSVAALTDGEDRAEYFRPNKIQRTSREDGTPRPFPDRWEIQKKGMNFLTWDCFRTRKELQMNRVDTDSDQLWEKNFDKLVEYKALSGDANVPVYFKDRELVAWVEEQRKAFHNGSLPLSLLVRLQELNFVFHATDDNNKEIYVTTPEDLNILNGQNQVTTKSVSSSPDPAISLRDLRFGMSSPSIKNPYAKPLPRSTFRDPGAREWDFASRLQSTSNSQVEVSDNSSRRPPVAASSLEEASGSPKNILERLQPHPPTPEMVEHDAKNATEKASASLRDERATDEQAVLNITDDTDNISALSKDGGDEEDPFLEEASSGNILTHSFNNLCCSGSAFLVRISNIGSGVFFRLMLIMHVLRSFIAAMKHAHGKEDKGMNTKDQEDKNDGQLAGEEEENVPFEQDMAAKNSYFTNILRQGVMVLWFCLHQAGWLLVSCVTFILYALGFSAGVGIVMGYLILLGKIDVPAVNDALGVHCAMRMN